jgi:rhodanese-related sulfurtransferase
MILRMLWQSALLLVLGAAGAWATWKWNPERPELYLIIEQAGPDEITVTEARKLEKGKGVIWIDARTRSEFDKAHIPGALLLNLYEWEDLMVPVIETLKASEEERTIIVYCDSQKCGASREIREKMIGFGLGELDIRVLHGGWPAWQAAGR